MMVSTKGRYALRVMIDLAEHQTDGYIPLKSQHAKTFPRNAGKHYQVAREKQYARRPARQGGGYRLTREPDQYTIGEVLR